MDWLSFMIVAEKRFACCFVGVELGGALKNVLAIACGICDGLEFGNNARAGLITRGDTHEDMFPIMQHCFIS